jgi:hypothetical protein
MKNRATPGTKTPTRTKIRLAGVHSSHRQQIDPQKERVNAEIGQKAAKIIEDKHAAIDENHRCGKAEGCDESETNGEHEEISPTLRRQNDKSSQRNSREHLARRKRPRRSSVFFVG